MAGCRYNPCDISRLHGERVHASIANLAFDVFATNYMVGCDDVGENTVKRSRVSNVARMRRILRQMLLGFVSNKDGRARRRPRGIVREAVNGRR